MGLKYFFYKNETLFRKYRVSHYFQNILIRIFDNYHKENLILSNHADPDPGGYNLKKKTEKINEIGRK